MAAIVAVVCAATPAAIRAELDGGWSLGLIRHHRRDADDRRIVAARQAVPCPQGALVVLALGQSNAANHLAAPVAAEPGVPAFVFHSGRCMPMADPVPGATGAGGSLWSALGQRLSRDLRLPVVVLVTAVSGTAVADWRRDREGTLTRARRLIASAAEQGLVPDVVIWLQGETDSERGTTQARYQADLIAVAGVIDAAIGRPPIWFISLTSRCYAAMSPAIRSAQERVAAMLPGGRVGVDTDALDNRFRSNGCHFNAAGREAIVSELVGRIRTTRGLPL